MKKKIKKILKGIGLCIFVICFLGSFVVACFHSEKQKEEHINDLVNQRVGKILSSKVVCECE